MSWVSPRSNFGLVSSPDPTLSEESETPEPEPAEPLELPEPPEPPEPPSESVPALALAVALAVTVALAVIVPSVTELAFDSLSDSAEELPQPTAKSSAGKSETEQIESVRMTLRVSPDIEQVRKWEDKEGSKGAAERHIHGSRPAQGTSRATVDYFEDRASAARLVPHSCWTVIRARKRTGSRSRGSALRSTT